MITINDLFNSAGWKAVNRLGTLSEMHYIFNQNYRDLEVLLQKIHNNTNCSKEIFKEAFEHLSQYIFNYLSAAASLRNQALKMIQYYDKEEILTIYEQKAKETFENNGYAQFVICLRNYQTHNKIEYPNPVRSSEDEKCWDVVLLSDDLLTDSKGWNSTAKKYIKECGKEINLNKTFKEYTNIVNAFYMWLYNLLFEHHKEDFTEKDKMAKELGISVEDLKVKLSDLIV